MSILLTSLGGDDRGVQLLIDRELVITPQRLERIHQAIMFYADSVCVRVTSEVPGNEPAQIRRLRELQEIEAISTWAHEYEVNDGGMSVGGSWQSVLSGPAGRVLTQPQVKDLVQGVDADLHITDRPDTQLREGIAEVVQFRQSVIGLRLADALTTEGLLTSRNYAESLADVLMADRQAPSDYDEIIETIVDLCRFGSLSELPMEAIIDCRRHMPAFRKYLRQKTTEAPERDAQSLATQVIDEYQDLLMRYAKDHEVRELAMDIGWDVLGALLPPSVFVKYIGKPVEWSKRRREFRPFLLLSRIRSHQQRS
jgi:hypothetical protein